VPFRGTGWVYLGEANAGRGISYLSRRTDPEGQSFIFRLDEAGEYELKFYKQDFIRDYILNDHVRVIVEDAPGQDSSFYYPGEPLRLVAEPRWPPPENPAGQTDSNEASPPADTPGEQPPEAAAAGMAAASQDSLVPEPAAAAEMAVGQGGASPEDAAELLPAALLKRAREEYEAGHFPEALAALDEFCSNFPLGSDEAWWLYGQLLESAGPRRDIRGALEYYRRLVREYPQSPRCDDARKRIAYLERFYFNIR
jgi:tetratricopeptide (TPR) repeat protein